VKHPGWRLAPDLARLRPRQFAGAIDFGELFFFVISLLDY
jgi:hypothetical protein